MRQAKATLDFWPLGTMEREGEGDEEKRQEEKRGGEMIGDGK